MTDDLRTRITAAIDAHCWSEFADTGETVTVVMRDDAIDAVMAVISEALHRAKNENGARCRWCGRIVNEAWAKALRRDAQPHLMTCRFYVGPVEHHATGALQPTVLGYANECSCGTYWGDDEGGCSNAAETWRGPASNANA